MKNINFEKNKLLNLYYLVLLLVSVFFIASILFDIFEIHIYRTDDLYYITQDIYYEYHFSHEGRWINLISSSFLPLISGKILSLFIMFFFFYFIFISSYRWSKNFYYAIIVSLLFLQIPSLYAQLLWPATSVLAFFVLALSAFVVRFLPIYIFYMLFGILFFGTLSNFYYLLPLLHLSLLTSSNIRVNLKVLFLKIIPAWALGFIVGYVITQVIIYITTGHLMTILPSREPHYIHSINDLIDNTLQSFYYLQRDIGYIFSNIWMIILFFIAILLAFSSGKKQLLFISFILYFAIIIIHYVAVIPIGIYIAPRTVLATWVGILAIAFYIPLLKQWQVFFITPVIIFFTFSLYEQNHTALQWYNTVTNTYYTKLLEESPQPSQKYQGIILFEYEDNILKQNMIIVKQFNLYKDDNKKGSKILTDLNDFWSWTASANEAGFEEVIFCSKDGYIDMSERSLFHARDAETICKNISKIYDANKIYPQNNNNFYTIIGEYNGMLIISLNSNFKF